MNAHSYCRAITTKASQFGFRLAFQKHEQGYSWQWAHGAMAIPVVGWADPADAVAALAMACQDLAKAMGWEYRER